MERMILIVDPQVDFINGSLPVPGALPAMDRLADYILLSDERYALKIITADRHPYDHCSFKDNGGEWPRHCVHDTIGAAVWPSVFEAAYSTAGETFILHKGCEKNQDQYSIFQNPQAAEFILTAIRKYGIGKIDICGLAGDVCVLNTLLDASRLLPDLDFTVFRRFTPSLDGGKALEQLIAQYGFNHD